VQQHGLDGEAGRLQPGRDPTWPAAMHVGEDQQNLLSQLPRWFGGVG
jgi:hypothetical protein